MCLCLAVGILEVTAMANTLGESAEGEASESKYSNAIAFTVGLSSLS